MKKYLRWMDDDPYDEKPGHWYDSVMGFIVAVATIFVGVFINALSSNRKQPRKVVKHERNNNE